MKTRFILGPWDGKERELPEGRGHWMVDTREPVSLRDAPLKTLPRCRR